MGQFYFSCHAVMGFLGLLLLVTWTYEVRGQDKFSDQCGWCRLPVVVLRNVEGNLDDPNKSSSAEAYISKGGQPEFQGHVKISVRGRSSRAFPKRQYHMELRDSAASLLGMAADEDWILSGPYLDRALLRNALAFELAAAADQWAPRYQFVQLYFLPGSDNNVSSTTFDQYRGVYMLMETIKVTPGRLAIKQMSSDSVNAFQSSANNPSYPGGYVLEVSSGVGELYWDVLLGGWQSLWQPNSDDVIYRAGPSEVYMKYPKPSKAPAAAAEYMKQYLGTLDKAILSIGAQEGNMRDKAFEMLDQAAFVDYLLHSELAKDVDAYTSSVYFHKDADKPLRAGPVWDKDLAYGNEATVTNTSGWQFSDPSFQSKSHVAVWVAHLLSDSQLSTAVETRWKSLRSGPWSDAKLEGVVSKLQSAITESAACRNFKRWPIDQVQSPSRQIQLMQTKGSWVAEVSAVRDWLLKRAAWIDANI